MKYAWIARHKTHWPVTLACEVLGVSASGYFEHWRRKDANKPSRPGANKRISEEALLVHIRAIHVEVKQEYGWPKMWKELLARGIRVGKERVQKMMQRHGIKARGKRKFVVTTDSKHNLPIAPNLLARNFTTEAPNLTWTSDITYIACRTAPEPRHAQRIGDQAGLHVRLHAPAHHLAAEQVDDRCQIQPAFVGCFDQAHRLQLEFQGVLAPQLSIDSLAHF